jgi:uncharacterized protein (DUF3084 family)
VTTDSLEFGRIERAVELAEAGDGTVTLDARAARDLIESVRTNEWAVADLDEAKEKQEDAEESLRDAETEKEAAQKELEEEREKLRSAEEEIDRLRTDLHNAASDRSWGEDQREKVARLTNDFNDLKARRKAGGCAG